MRPKDPQKREPKTAVARRRDRPAVVIEGEFVVRSSSTAPLVQTIERGAAAAAKWIYKAPRPARGSDGLIALAARLLAVATGLAIACVLGFCLWAASIF